MYNECFSCYSLDFHLTSILFPANFRHQLLLHFEHSACQERDQRKLGTNRLTLQFSARFLAFAPSEGCDSSPFSTRGSFPSSFSRLTFSFFLFKFIHYRFSLDTTAPGPFLAICALSDSLIKCSLETLGPSDLGPRHLLLFRALPRKTV